MEDKKTIILRMSCDDAEGIIAKATAFVSENKGNIINLEQHVDSVDSVFFMRIEWSLNGFNVKPENISKSFLDAMSDFSNIKVYVDESVKKKKTAIFVSKQSHCLIDLLARWQEGDLNVDIDLIISNHSELSIIANQFHLPFHHIPISHKTKKSQETKQIDLLKKHNIELIILARYMQIVSPNFVNTFKEKIINIHHSFLPAFPGAKPYHSAYERGVKLIGATSHYVTAELDGGPIITQETNSVSHIDSIEDLVRKGKDIEKRVLAEAIFTHVQYKTMIYKNRTVIFS